MPTSLTEPVQTGKMSSFKEFALRCARQFGACASLRDEPLDKKIPEFTPDPYRLERVEDARQALEALRNETPEEIEEVCAQEVAASAAYLERVLREKQEWRDRYEAMLQKVQAWQVPSDAHHELKAFMQKQLHESMEWDCSTAYLPQTPTMPEDLAAWHQARIDCAEEDLRRAEKALQAEYDNCARSNEWVRQLLESLKGVD